MTAPTQVPQQADGGSLLLDLAARCEAATGPDRDIDAAIACFIGKPLGDIDHWLHGSDIAYRPTSYGYYVPVLPNGITGDAFASQQYTGSLDAARTLVPSGWGWTLGDKYPEASIAWCEIEGLPWSAGYGWAVERRLMVEGRTPALALCSAALRARASASA